MTQEQYHNDQKGMAELDAVEIHAPEDNDNEFEQEEKTPVHIRRATSVKKGKQTKMRACCTNCSTKLTLTHSFDILELERAKQENLQADRMLEEQEMKAKTLQERLQAKEKRRKTLKLQQQVTEPNGKCDRDVTGMTKT